MNVFVFFTVQIYRFFDKEPNVSANNFSLPLFMMMDRGKMMNLNSSILLNRNP